MALIRFFKNELTGWKRWELIWLSVACGTILAASLALRERPLELICALSGAALVVFTGKGKPSAYIFGFVNSLLYGLIAIRARYFGEAIINLVYYLPMQVYGFWVWSHHMNQENNEVQKKVMSRRAHFLLVLIISSGTLLYGTVLWKVLKGSLPYMDAFGTVTAVIVIFVSVRMYIEQWVIWFAENVVTSVMWIIAYRKGNASFATILMWLVFLANSIIMFFRWKAQIPPGRENAVTDNTVTGTPAAEGRRTE